MSQIRLTPDMMRTRANEYRNESHKMDAIIKKCSNLLSQLQQEWDGKASHAFQLQFESLKPEMVKMTQLIDAIAIQLTQTANAIESLDNEIASKLR